jgi:hypothetical protein
MYGRKQTPPIVAKVDDKNAKSTEDITKQIHKILAPAEKNISAPAGNNISATAGNNNIINAVLENVDVKKAIDNYTQKKQASKKADAELTKATESYNKKNKRTNTVEEVNKARKTLYKAKDASDKALKDANAAKNAIDSASYKAFAKYNPTTEQEKDIDKAINEAIDKAIAEITPTSVEAINEAIAETTPTSVEAIKNAIAKTNPLSDNSKQQLTIALPFFLQIYESLYDDKNYEGNTQISRHTTIPNRAIMDYVVREIQKIEKNHPHPQLFESIFYFWNIFNLSTALSVLMAYLSEIPVGEASESHPGQIVTIVEKQLGNASSFQEWDDSTTKPHDYRIYTKVFGQKFNPFRYADGALLALTKHPFTTYNPYITRRDMEINVDKETGAFENITNTAQEPLPQIRGKKSSEKNPLVENPLATINQANATVPANAAATAKATVQASLVPRS